MGAIDYLRDQGFSVRLSGQRIVVSPASALTPTDRQYIKLHRIELLAEVAANDGETRRTSWTVLRNGHRPFTINGAPMTRAEALADVRGRGWPDADIQET